MPEHLLSDRQLEERGIRSRSSAQKDRVRGTGIPFVYVGRLVRYRESDVEAYLASLPTHRSTSEASAGTHTQPCGDISHSDPREPKAPTRHKKISLKAASELHDGG